MFPDFLYRLDARDEQSQVLSVLQLSGLTQAATANVDVDLGPIPNDKIAIITAMSAYGIPDTVAETILHSEFYLLDPGNNATAWVHAHYNPIQTAGQPWSTSWSGYAVLMPGNSMRMRMAFDAVAPVGTHAVQAWLHGLIMPRGNILEY